MKPFYFPDWIEDKLSEQVVEELDPELSTAMVSRFESFLGISTPPIDTYSSPKGARGFVHERFPGAPRRRNASVMSNYDTNMPSKTQTSSQTSGKVKLPRLVFDNTPLPPRRSNNCSYISNHKAYLRMKGFQLSNVYSVKRHKSKSPDFDGANKRSGSKEKLKDFGNSNPGPPECITALFHPDRKYEFYGRNKFKKENSPDLWKPYDPKANRESYGPVRSLKELDEEIPIPGHVPRVDLHQRRLGRMITSARMRELLSEEEPVIPRAFYSLEASGILSPRYDK